MSVLRRESVEGGWFSCVSGRHQCKFTAMLHPLRQDLDVAARRLSPAGAWAVVLADIGQKPAVVGAGDKSFRFELGSITKVFTALLLLRAAALGRLREDECALALLGVKGETRLPVRALAAHASGLPEWPDDFRPAPDSLFAHYTEADLLAALGRDAPTLRADAGYRYSSYGSAILGAAVAKRLGLAYTAACSRLVLEPGGLAGAGFTAEPGFTRFGCFAPAGGLVASMADLQALLGLLLQPPDAGWESCLARAEEVQLATGVAGMAMALGWHVRLEPGPCIHWHNGRTPRGRAFVGYSRTAKRAVALATNGDVALDELGFSLLAGTER